MIKHRNQKQVEKESVYFYLVYTSTLLFIKVRAGTQYRARAWRQKLIQRPWSGAVLLVCLLWLSQPAFL